MSCVHRSPRFCERVTTRARDTLALTAARDARARARDAPTGDRYTQLQSGATRLATKASQAGLATPGVAAVLQAGPTNPVTVDIAVALANEVVACGLLGACAALWWLPLRRRLFVPLLLNDLKVPPGAPGAALALCRARARVVASARSGTR
jgi:hypothetical protein